jgi:hypothetical protein
MRKIVFNILLFLQFSHLFAQTSALLIGVAVDAKTQKPLQGAIVSILNTNLVQIADENGKFSFINLQQGKQILRLSTNGYKEQLLKIEIFAGKQLDLGILYLDEDISTEQEMSLITITDNDLSDDNSGSENTAGLLQSTRDAFLQVAAFNLGQARFNVRGIDNEYSNILINGISMNRVSDGRPQYSNWGGLNDATRNQEFVNGSSPTDYSFGGIAGTQFIDTRASICRPGTRISFLGTNTNYNFRSMATYASGMNEKGWAFVVSGSRRWAQEGFFDGTNYAANSLFTSIEKKINNKHSLNFTAIYAQNKRGKNSPNTQEITNLKDFKYNSYWGFQEGEKRNSRIKEVEEPIFILSHYWKINFKTNLQTNFSYQFGKIGNSRIDSQKAVNPDPTYYTNLPSYYSTLYKNVNDTSTYTPDFEKAETIKTQFLNKPQLDWKSIYQANKNSLENGSRYVLYEDRSDDKTWIANTILSAQLSENILLNAGANLTKSSSNNFKNLIDLLGGKFYNDINVFGIDQNQQQSDLNYPNRTAIEGEKYGYNYTVNTNKFDAFTQFKFTYNKVDFYLGQSFSRSSYEREGWYKNGFYPNNSFGKSNKINFDNFGFKGGATYKLTGQQFIDFNGVYMTKAPNSKDVFPNARLSNQITDSIANETISSIDASYIFKTPNLKLRLTAFLNQTSNSTDISFYYADNINEGTGEFVSEVVTGQNKRNLGIEAGVEYQLTTTIKAIAMAAYGDYVYINNPNLVLGSDGAVDAIFKGKTNMQGYKISGSPQQAYSVGLEYRDPRFWWIGANFNLLANNYLRLSPMIFWRKKNSILLHFSTL